MNRKRINKQGGFTLVELAVAMVIIGILLGAILKGQQLIDSARGKQLLSDVKAMEALVWTYYDRHGVFPGDCTSDGLIGLATLSASATVAGAPEAADKLDTAVAVPTTLDCITDATGVRDVAQSKDSAIADLRVDKLLTFSGTNLQASTHSFGGQITIGALNDGTNIRNVIAVYDVPQWVAEMVDSNIDGIQNGLTGRVRNLSAVTGAVWPAKTATEANTAFFYAFDKEF